MILLHDDVVNTKKQRELVIAQERKGLPSHKLKVDVVTRWGSSYEMVERMMEQMEAIRVVLASDRKSSHLTFMAGL